MIVLLKTFLAFSLLVSIAMALVGEYLNNSLVVFLGLNFTILIFLFIRKLIPPLTAFYLLATSLPFIHLLFYFNFNYKQSYESLWGLATNQYMFNEVVIGSLLCLAVIWTSSSLLFVPFRMVKISKAVSATIARPFVMILLIIAVYLVWASAPEHTLFQAVYMQSHANVKMNFSSAWALSYYLLIMCVVYCDEKVPRLRAVIVVLVLFVSFYYGLLRGDREPITFLLALGLYFHMYKRSLSTKSLVSLNPRIILYAFVLIFIINGVIGGVRSTLVSGYSDFFEVFLNIDPSSLVHGTWSAVLLTPLSVYYDLVIKGQPYLLGKDYIDLFLSLPPGFIADIFGYQRPWSASGGPSHEMIFGLGGTHISVLPLRNFGLLGVICMAVTAAVVIRMLESRAYRSPTFFMRIFYVSMFFIIPHWVWYSEKIIINHLIFALLIYLMGNLFSGNRFINHSRYPDDP